MLNLFRTRESEEQSEAIVGQIQKNDKLLDSSPAAHNTDIHSSLYDSGIEAKPPMTAKSLSRRQVFAQTIQPPQTQPGQAAPSRSVLSGAGNQLDLVLMKNCAMSNLMDITAVALLPMANRLPPL
ncbi:hypothetical protein MATL_G00068260 [Megalops atlanticus]|uniref:Uncharacterized protein n=1 Tax=Megalops atlanticus TaxID=7932 RepID=A0A9D3Q968_MEGAT|nr:hypothetical protein MATL_G00068260 [Megalops atlanticus]